MRSQIYDAFFSPPETKSKIFSRLKRRTVSLRLLNFYLIFRNFEIRTGSNHC